MNKTKHLVLLLFLLALLLESVFLCLLAPGLKKPLERASLSADKNKTIPQVPSKHYQQALPGYAFQFPFDHGNHPAFKTEWWYYTGHLTTQHSQKEYGFELTFFRVGSGLNMLPKEKLTQDWALNDLYLAHFALSDKSNRQFYFQERLGRTGANQAGAKAGILSVWLKDWSVHQNTKGQMILSAWMPEGTIHLTLNSLKPPVVHGHNGVSQKANCIGCASHYYSFTRLTGEGTLSVGENPTEPVQALAWMDHEFGSNQLTEKQVGWDWFSIQLNNGEEIMLYRLRQKDGQVDPVSSGSIIDVNGNKTALSFKQVAVKPLSFWKSPHSKGVYPMGWQIHIPDKKLTLTVQPIFEQQELTTQRWTGVQYWEGACTVTGSQNKQPINGKAYVELTGYAKAFKQKL